MFEALPDRVVLNNVKEDLVSILLPFETVTTASCDICGLELEALLIGENNRFKGSIKSISSGTTLWYNNLPKDEEKAKSLLLENLKNKIDTHKGRH